MFDIKVLNREETEKVLDMKDVIEVVEDVYKQKAMDSTSVFPLVFHEFEPGVADMDIKSGWLKGSDIFGMKVVSWFKDNPQKGFPALVGLIMVFDDKTGAPLGLLDGSHITGMRTGAAGAIGAKYLARPDSKNLLVVGAGHVAEFEIIASLMMLPNIERVMVYDPIDRANAGALADKMVAFAEKNNMDCGFDVVSDIAEATGISDIIITVTPSKEPIIKSDWVKNGTHFSCIGSDMSGKEEIDPNIFKGAKIFVDDIPQCINVGEIEIPLRDGVISEKDIAGEIGEVLIDAGKGRDSDEQITVFDATGTALLDLATAKLAFKKADEVGIGASIEL